MFRFESNGLKVVEGRLTSLASRLLLQLYLLILQRVFYRRHAMPAEGYHSKAAKKDEDYKVIGTLIQLERATFIILCIWQRLEFI